MFDEQELLDRLGNILEALERILRRFAPIQAPDAFLADDAVREHLDSICMVLLAVGESFRQLDRKTGGKWLARYPEITVA